MSPPSGDTMLLLLPDVGDRGGPFDPEGGRREYLLGVFTGQLERRVR